MKIPSWIRDSVSRPTTDIPAPDWPAPPPAGGILDGLGQGWQWDDLSAEVARESQARVALVGLPGAGKRFLLNRLLGWEVVERRPGPVADLEPHYVGSFVLVQLPAAPAPARLDGPQLHLALGAPDLVLYLLDGAVGLRPADFHYVAALRAAGHPLVVALNKWDLAPDLQVDELAARLGTPPLPISALTGANVEERLLPALLQANPRLAIPLGREIGTLRRMAARRVVRQGALYAALLGAQPLPLVDLPMQALLQSGVVLRVGAAFGHAPGGGVTREMIGAVFSAVGAHYTAQSLAKLLPILGSIVAGLLAAAATVLMGELAIRYYEAGATVPLPDWIARRRDGAALTEGEEDAG